MRCDVRTVVNETFGTHIPIESETAIATLDHSCVLRVALDHPIKSVIVKESTSPEGLALAQREAQFYKAIAPLLPEGVCPACHLVKVSDEATIVVLEDVRGETFSPDALRTEDDVVMYVEALARLSRASDDLGGLEECWNHAFGSHAYNAISGRANSYPARLDRFLKRRDHNISKEVLSLLNATLQLVEQPEFRLTKTIVHGDAHFGNALIIGGEIRLVDWANTALGFGEIDLAHLIALNLPQSRRKASEARLLEIYAEQTGHALSGVQRNYKLGCLYAVQSAIGMWEFGVPNWRELFENATKSAIDLDAQSEVIGVSL